MYLLISGIRKSDGKADDISILVFRDRPFGLHPAVAFAVNMLLLRDRREAGAAAAARRPRAAGLTAGLRFD